MNLTAHDIIIRPVITEKSSSLMAMNKYTFEVHRDANKIQIRKAVEEVFSVKVDSVNTINVKGKLRRRGASKGYTRSWKKAIVALKPDQHIEFFEGATI
ncbi:MAG: 50S ribosomal protein L23 [Synergistaceae bacterium]|nr:50S ribosomal protein L23 [Synergistaceae bacterium]